MFSLSNTIAFTERFQCPCQMPEPQYLYQFKQCWGGGDVEVYVNVPSFLSHVQGRPVLKGEAWNQKQHLTLVS